MTETITEAFDLDTLMSLDPLDLTKDNLDAVIAYHRNLRAERHLGKGKEVRARMKAAAGAGPKLNIAELMRSRVVAVAPSSPIVRRRV